MNVREGFALPAVMVILVILSLSIAVSAQRTLRVVRGTEFATAEADMQAAALAARVSALETNLDSACCTEFRAGTVLASHADVVEGTQMRWQVIGVAAPFADLEVTIERAMRRGTARLRFRLPVVWEPDTAGQGRWKPTDDGGWVRLPSQ